MLRKRLLLLGLPILVGMTWSLGLTTSTSCNTGDCAEDALSVCGFTCRDLQSDIANCGTCNNVCLSDQSCVAGACLCPDNGSVCVDTCRDLQNDNDNCGSCGNVCTATGQSCAAGRCECDVAGQSVCEDVCVDLAQDNNNCGSCGNACTTNADGIVLGCVLGLCCEGGELNCDGVCTDPDTDPDFCGASGECVDEAERGVACRSDQVCTAGECACPDGEEECTLNSGDVVCVDQTTDRNHCGDCNNVCDAAQDCVDSQCV